jgi:hypothetical protein
MPRLALALACIATPIFADTPHAHEPRWPGSVPAFYEATGKCWADMEQPERYRRTTHRTILNAGDIRVRRHNQSGALQVFVYLEDRVCLVEMDTLDVYTREEDQ